MSATGLDESRGPESKDLANTATQIACGWRLYGDLARLRELAGSVVSINLLTGDTTVEGRKLSPGLEIADGTSHRLRDRFDRDQVPPDAVVSASLTLSPAIDDRGHLIVESATIHDAGSTTYQSQDGTRWHRGD